MIPEKDWIDILSAMLTPTIAMLAFYIAYQQWRTNQNRLKLELFEKRYELFLSINKFISSILTSGVVERGAEIQFFTDTRAVIFLFNKNIADLMTEMYKMANKLHTLEKTQKNLAGKNLEENVNKQYEIREWFERQLADMDNVFREFLKIEH